MTIRENGFIYEIDGARKRSWQIVSDDQLKAAVALSAKRLEAEKYQPDHVFLTEEESHGWPGDTEGRTLLAEVLQRAALGVEPRYMAEIFRRAPAHLNERGYMGPVRDDCIDEQQLSGNGWMLRALCEYADREPNPVIDARGIAQKLAHNLFVPWVGKFSTYPIDPASRATGGAESGSIVEGGNNGLWRLSTDIGCIFIGLDGLVHAWRTTGDDSLRPAIAEIIAVFKKIEPVKIQAQTHATLTGMRALLRYDAKANLEFVEKRFREYCEYGMTDHCENFNWYGREDTWTEPCAIVDSLLVARQLADLTGKQVYTDYGDKILAALLEHQRANGGFGLRKTFPRGSDHPPVDHCDEAHWCCTMRGGAGLAYSLLRRGR